MKKSKFLIAILIIMMCQIVHALDEPSLSVDCKTGKVIIGEELTCDIYVVHQNVPFNTVSFTVDTDLDLSFNAVSGKNVTRQDANINIKAANVIENTTSNKEKMATMTIKKDLNLEAGTKDIVLRSIHIGNDETGANYDSADITETITFIALSQLDGDNTLKTLTVDGKAIDGFSPSKTKYEVEVIEKEIVFIDGSATSSKASVLDLGSAYVPLGKTTKVIVTVIAENRTEREYTLMITNRKKSKDNNLKTLELYNGKEKIEFDYDPSKLTYDVELSDSSITKLDVKATLNDEHASFVSKYGPRTVNINYGKNKIEVRVKSETEVEKVYVMNVTRLDDREGVDTLKSLKVTFNDVVTLEENKYEYEVKVKYAVDKTTIEALPTSDKSKVEYKDIDLKEGENNLTIKVIAENGTKQEYLLHITRLTEEESREILENISITGYSFPFSKNRLNYDLKILEDADELNITVTPNNIKYEVVGNKDLKDGSVIKITVTDDEGVKNYTINVQKDSSLMVNIISYAVFGLGTILLLVAIIIASKRKKRRALQS